MYIFNTRSKQIEKINPINPHIVTLYSCGPTVYDYTHIGHLRTYMNIDILKRALIMEGYKVKHVLNITDVGHLTGDDDTGEDKVEKKAKKEGKSIQSIIDYYTKFFFDSTNLVNIVKPTIIAKVTDHIADIINLIKVIENKGYTYKTEQALYFNIDLYKNYGQLSNQQLDQKIHGARNEVKTDSDKKNPADFALWFKRKGRFAQHLMYWKSPWGDGFPGWHIECSAISMKYLGNTIDIHAGGTDHIPIHHENEIAQSESATGKRFVNYWFHPHFVMINEKKMSKSLKNIYTIEDLNKRKITPLALRYLFLQTHYRQISNFTWDALTNAQTAYHKLLYSTDNITKQPQTTTKLSSKADNFLNEFNSNIKEDLQIPKALSVLWEVVKSSLPNDQKALLLTKFDDVLGLDLINNSDIIPDSILAKAKKRFVLRNKGMYKQADEIRKEIEKKGYLIEDINNKYKVKTKR